MVENVKQVIQNASKARETKAESFWGFFCKSCGGTLKQKSVSLSNKWPNCTSLCVGNGEVKIAFILYFKMNK